MLSTEAKRYLEVFFSKLAESDKVGIDVPRTLLATSRRTFLNKMRVFLREPSRAIA